jgi:hypothetical protein
MFLLEKLLPAANGRLMSIRERAGRIWNDSTSRSPRGYLY